MQGIGMFSFAFKDNQEKKLFTQVRLQIDRYNGVKKRLLREANKSSSKGIQNSTGSMETLRHFRCSSAILMKLGKICYLRNYQDSTQD
jgi:hypothetical protein